MVNIYIKPLGLDKEASVGFCTPRESRFSSAENGKRHIPRFFSIFLALKSQDWLWVVYLSLAISMIRNLLIFADLPCSLF